ncbi:DUF2190 family protein [Rothia koreensis]|uniref:DUF2190 family protein n=1 Tax=Rothia koreensis TaxID=592378 RepID=UPI0037C72647
MAMEQRYTECRHITLPAPYFLWPGQPVRVGQFVGVAQTEAQEGDRVTVWLDGSYNLPVDAPVTVGQLVNINEMGNLTTGRGVPFGIALTATAKKGVAEIAPFGKLQAPVPAPTTNN